MWQLLGLCLCPEMRCFLLLVLHGALRVLVAGLFWLLLASWVWGNWSCCLALGIHVEYKEFLSE